MKRSFATRHCIPLVPLCQPIPVEVIDGSCIAPMIHETTLLDFIINDIRFQSKLFILEEAQHDIVLGMSFLRQVNPLIDWESSRMRSRFVSVDQATQTDGMAGPLSSVGARRSALFVFP